MTPRLPRILLLGIPAAALLGLVWYFAGRTDSVDLASSDASIAQSSPLPPAPRAEGQAARDSREAGLPALAVVTPLPLGNPADRSPLADKLHAPEQTGLRDLAVVFDLFHHYREKFGGLPTGENNAQIVNALTGNNPLRLALIERSHPAINPRGELTDRWGSPFFFHLISHDALEIRSAGPDKGMWTEDDLLLQSPSLRQPSREP